MNSAADDIATILIEEISGYVLGANLFLNGVPTEPDNCITIIDTVGRAPMRSLTPTDAVFNDSVQIIARNRVYADGFAELIEIRNTLLAIHHEDYNGTSYQLFRLANGPAFLIWDNNNRAEIVMNINIIRKEA
jgi:hypothetical protein